MRTFHVGGTASTVAENAEIILKRDGIVKYNELRTVTNDEGKQVVLNKNGSVIILTEEGVELEAYPLQTGTILEFADGAKVKQGDKLAAWDPHSAPIIVDVAGVVVEEDFEEGITVSTAIDEASGSQTRTITDSRTTLHPRLVIKEVPAGKNPASIDLAKCRTLNTYSIPTGATVMVSDGQLVTPGTTLAKTTRGENKTRDITGGLPRVAELFEARTPKDVAEISKIDGIIDFGENERGKRVLIVKDEVSGFEEKHYIPLSKQIVVFKDDHVRRGQQLTEGSVSPQEILDVCGPQELQRYLVNEVQQIYRLQEVQINDKHIEIIIRQMLRKIRIENPGDTDFLYGEQVSRHVFEETNAQMAEEGKRPAEGKPALLGITKASLETDSFISAASFQDTTRVLTEASTLGRVDELRGFKENVILGHLIPGGTGFPMHRYIKMVPLGTPISQDEMDEVYGKKDENGISTDTIEIPPEELVDDYADLNAAVEGIASPIETVDGDDGIEDAFASISETDASGDYED
jgi:DNA-directed RNA polymerase subunit beta'